MESKIMPKVFGWMFIGLLVTFITGIFVSTNENMLLTIYSTGWLIGIVIVELALVIFLSARISKMSTTTARISFLLYSFISGLTFSSIFVTYQLTSIIWVFLATALTFGLFALYGLITKKDLTKLGSILIMVLIGSLVCVLLNIFIKNSAFDLIISILTILIFVGFTAYDIQKIKRIELTNSMNEDNLAIYGALQLYLDFVNIFLELLNLFGDSKN